MKFPAHHAALGRVPWRVGCAGWSIPRASAARFRSGASILARYATRFDAVEINSSFYRPHRIDTYRRWADAVPAGFLFSAKVPRSITHDARLAGVGRLLDEFLIQVGGLGDALGGLLVQLPPSLALDRRTATTFLRMLRARFDGPVALEPRHASWFDASAIDLFERYRVARVGADPAPVMEADTPAGSQKDWRYLRLHGAPRIYYSDYPAVTLRDRARALRASTIAVPTWIIFDNTALGHATANALTLQTLLRRTRRSAHA